MSVDRCRCGVSGVAQRNVQHEAFAGIEWPGGVLILELATRMPGGIEIQSQRKVLDRAGTIGKSEIVIKQKLRVVL